MICLFGFFLTFDVLQKPRWYRTTPYTSGRKAYFNKIKFENRGSVS
jgi:hypothetical protein